MTVYAAPGAAGAKIAYKAQYNNFIGGQFVAPVARQTGPIDAAHRRVFLQQLGDLAGIFFVRTQPRM